MAEGIEQKGAASNNSIRLRILKLKAYRDHRNAQTASNNSIRLRILKHYYGKWGFCDVSMLQTIRSDCGYWNLKHAKNSWKDFKLQTIRSDCGYWNRDGLPINQSLIYASNNSIRLRILKHEQHLLAEAALQASNNSIRLRILKHATNRNIGGGDGSFKQFDPIADTETFRRDCTSYL